MSPGKPVAKQGDQVVGTDIHIVVPESSGKPTPVPFPFNGKLDAELVTEIMCEGLPVAVKGSKASNTPPHVPTSGPFQRPPSNIATVDSGSTSVFAAGKPVARGGDIALTCNDPTDAPNGVVVASGTIFVG